MQALRQSTAPHQPVFVLKVLSAAMAACFATATVANPALPQIAAGTATLNRRGRSLVISNSDKAIINWRSFSIGAGEETRPRFWASCCRTTKCLSSTPTA